jgi:hypothetical protein
VTTGAVLAALADISAPQLLLIAAMGVLTSLIGGVAGYGTGALMPLVLVPIVGAEPLVPITTISALMTNTSRATAFRKGIDWRRAVIVMVCALPTCVLGAWGYTLLPGRGAAASPATERAEPSWSPAISISRCLCRCSVGAVGRGAIAGDRR